ncbi:MAG: cadmium-translocating P-type ATPase [Clostridia bacterium]|nr:cadmium-translocating P-type ATPase [Clostridia bacterium]
MTAKQKKTLLRIIISAALLIVLRFVPVDGYLKLGLYLLPYALIGYDVLIRAVKGIISGQVFDENFLMAIATVGAMALESYSEGVEVMLFYQIGELFQSYAVGRSRRSISALMDIRPDFANVERDGDLVSVDPDEVSVGDVIIIRPGERVPLDGTVIDGESSLNTAALTGESLPRSVKAGDEVVSGSVNVSGLLKVRVSRIFEESTVSRILELVENSSLKKAKAENFITRFAHYYTPAVCLMALALAVLPPLFVGGFRQWLMRALSFLVISCPCALVISIPLTFFGGIGGASRSGILVKGGNYLEAMSEARTIVFDKTGTLTEGVFAVRQIQTAPGVDAEDLVVRAALCESYSNHPISQSLRARAEGHRLDVNRVTDVEELAGCGITARLDGQPMAVGNARLMKLLQIDVPTAQAQGTIIYVARGGKYEGMIVISDAVKATSRPALDALRKQGVKTVMLTGDSRTAAAQVADQLGIEETHAELLPQDKVDRLEDMLRNKQGAVCFVGDGINDAPVLSRADIGIAMGGVGSDAAIEAADIVLMDDDPRKISLAMRISHRCLRIVHENIAFALTVKAVCLVLGALGITGMQMAIFADVGVMILAVLNATRALTSMR